MLKIDMLPADKGDCLWIEYGDEDDPKRVLIDGGVTATYASELRRKLEVESKASAAPIRFEAVVLTHIDGDHIQGALELIGDAEAPVEIADVWFNGWHHIPQGVLSAVEAIAFTNKLWDRDLPWNRCFSEGAIMVDRDVDLPSVDLAGDLRLTVLSPTRAQLVKLKPVWDDALGRAGLVEGWSRRFLAQDEESDPTDSMNIASLADSPFMKDGSVPNGTSIALLAEWGDLRVLLAGDAHASVLEDSLRQLKWTTGEGRVRLDAFKLPHHGSARNLDAKLLSVIDCRDYLFSTNGHGHHHPDTKAIARILKYGRPSSGERIRLHFNYRSADNERWDDEELKREFDYEAHYPVEATGGLVVDVQALRDHNSDSGP
jgi:hypothetical protein